MGVGVKLYVGWMRGTLVIENALQSRHSSNNGMPKGGSPRARPFFMDRLGPRTLSSIKT